MSSDYPKKYWWVILIVLPVALALIGILPSFLNSTSSSTAPIQISNTEFSGDLHFANVEVILQEFQEITGKALTDSNLLNFIQQGVNLVKGGEYAAAIPLFKEIVKKADLPSIHNNLGVLYAENKDYAGARRAYRKSIAKQPDNQLVQLNLGLLDQREGHVEAAKKHFAKAPDLQTARKLEQVIHESLSDGTIESEPNNNLNAPNSLSLSTAVQGSIADGSDLDIFSFTTPDVQRDWIQVRLKNHSDKLRPYLRLRTEGKKEIGGPTADNAGQDLTYEFVSEPNKKYLAVLGSYTESSGSYELKVTSLEKYDPYEPNDNKDIPYTLTFDQLIRPNILDQYDMDYFEFTTDQDSGKVVVLVTASSSLRPYLRLYTSNKQEIGGPNADNKGQNLIYEFDGAPTTKYIILVGSYSQSKGEYQLIAQNK